MKPGIMKNLVTKKPPEEEEKNPIENLMPTRSTRKASTVTRKPAR